MRTKEAIYVLIITAISCILGHYTWTFDDPYFRILLLRGMAWAAGESPYRFERLVLRGIPLSRGGSRTARKAG